MSSTTTVIGTKKDLEIIWIDMYSRQPKDMNNVTAEVYHYLDSQPPQIKVPVREPYQIIEGINDTVNIASINGAYGYIVDKHIILDLNLINSNLSDLDCPPNDYVVSGTASKVAIVDGRKVFALSACELASLINLDASGYTASSEDGYLVITGSNKGKDWSMQVGNGAINNTLGLSIGDEVIGNDVELVYDLEPTPLTWVSTGRYILPSLKISNPPYKIGERYYVMFRAIEPVTLRPEISQEDFSVVEKPTAANYSYSFTK